MTSLNTLRPREDAERIAALARYAPFMDREEQLQELLDTGTRPEVVEAIKR